MATGDEQRLDELEKIVYEVRSDLAEIRADLERLILLAGLRTAA